MTSLAVLLFVWETRPRVIGAQKQGPEGSERKEENAERFEAKTTEEGFPPKARRRKKDKIRDPSGSEEGLWSSLSVGPPTTSHVQTELTLSFILYQFSWYKSWYVISYQTNEDNVFQQSLVFVFWP